MADSPFSWMIEDVRGPTAAAQFSRSSLAHPTPAWLRRRLRRYRHYHYPPPPPKCSCEAFRSCDRIWSRMTLAQRAVWNTACTRPGMYGYHLWMQECMVNFNAGWNAPDLPSPSGGWLSRPFTAGATWMPPQPCRFPPSPGYDCDHCEDWTPAYWKVLIYPHGSLCLPYAQEWWVPQDPVNHCTWWLPWADPNHEIQVDISADLVLCFITTWTEAWEVHYTAVHIDKQCYLPYDLDLLHYAPPCNTFKLPNIIRLTPFPTP